MHIHLEGLGLNEVAGVNLKQNTQYVLNFSVCVFSYLECFDSHVQDKDCIACRGIILTKCVLLMLRYFIFLVRLTVLIFKICILPEYS